MLPVGSLLHDTYRIERYLSSGGFGNTYVARHIHFDEICAVKEFFMRGINQRDNQTSVSVSNADNRDVFDEQLQKFKKEAQRLRRLNNEHIVRVHDLFEENGTAYYVMDFIDGENLSERLKRTQTPLTEAEVSALLPQMLDALDAVHQAGMLHLDLKPGNIMVDSNQQVRVIDFGASKQQGGHGGTTMSTSISYTQGYAPREQMEQNRQKFGPWTDIYALGATLYNLLTNEHPPMPSDIDEDHTADKQRALSFPSSVSPKMRNLVVGMMATNRDNRPQNIAAVRSLLEEKPAAKVADESTVISTKPQDEETVVATPKTPAPKPKPQAEASFTPTPQAAPVRQKPQSFEKKGSSIIVVSAFLLGLFFNFAWIVWSIFSESADNTQDASSQRTTNPIIAELVDNMVYVEGGTFQMGNRWGLIDEMPEHSVTLSSFYIGKYEVTQEQWKAVMGSNPSYFKGAKRPVECVSWYDCQEFIRKLNQLTGKNFRLPTEAEWEYAARGGNQSRGYIYSGSNTISDVAWYDDNSGQQTHNVGTKASNELGLYDMSGNVWEWCQDWYNSSYYSNSPQMNPTGPSSGSSRVIREGSWRNDSTYCLTEIRGYSRPTISNYRLGFRLAQ